MPLKGGRSTPQERKFVEAYAGTGDKTYSAAKAGYRQPAISGHHVAARPAVQAEIARVQQQRLFADALPLAINTLVSILGNDKTPAGARVQAAKVVLDRTLGQEGADRHKDPHEMTPDELDRAIAELRRLAAERARPIIEGETQPVANDSQLEEGESDVFG